jgi:hypothetical protein
VFDISVFSGGIFGAFEVHTPHIRPLSVIFFSYGRAFKRYLGCPTLLDVYDMGNYSYLRIHPNILCRRCDIMVQSDHPPANGFVAFCGRMYNPLGFAKGL